MKKTAKRFFSALLVLAMVLSMVPMTVFATEHEEHAVVETVVDTAVETTEETTETAAEEEKKDLSFNYASLAPALLNAEDVEVDESNPAIIALETELKEIKVLMADGSIGNLTEEQVQTILGTYQQYLDHWEDNANVLGVQTPFFLQYNDNEDSLGILGEMLILGGNTVDQIRNGELSFDDINGMISTFLFADQLGVNLYGSAVTGARDEVLDLVKASGAQTDAQKYLIINNWLAQNVVFDMEYIMNTDKEEGEEPMRAENPQEHEYYDIVYDAIYDVYEPEIEKQFRSQIEAGIVADLTAKFWENAIRSIYYDAIYAQALAQAKEEAMPAVKDGYKAAVKEQALPDARAAAEKEVYDAAYAEYEAHEHDLEVTFTWNDDCSDVDATAYCKNGHESYEAAELSEITVTSTATCTESGVATYSVTATFVDADKKKIEEVTGTKELLDPAGHDYDANGVCVRCGETDAGHTHSWNEGVVTTEPTCETTGMKTFTCTTCNATETQEIAALGHTWNEGEVTTEPGCETAGVKTFTCSACEETKTENIDALGHNYVDGVCTNCGTAESTDDNTGDDTTGDDTTGDEGTGNDNTGNIGTENTPETVEADGDEIDPNADAYAKAVVAEKQAEIEAAADAAATKAAEDALAALTEEELDAMAEDAVLGNEEAVAQLEAAANENADAMMEQDAEAISADPYGYCVNAFGQEAADQLQAACDNFVQSAYTEGVEVDPVNAPGYKMTVDQLVDQTMANEKIINLGTEEQPYMVTPNEAIPIYADGAAAQLTQAVLNYWQGSHFGALGRGSAVCLGYTKAFTYLVQCLKSDIYTTNGNINTASNWKSADELYYTNGALDITKNYAVDCVRITFDADVTMYGETQENFNSDHFWNAVQIDGQWYYVDPCYTDVYTEVMIRDRVETDGSMNHLYFLFSHGTTTSLYDGYYSEIKTLYADAANRTDYEDSWISRIKSNIYPEGGYFYYVYDSTDMVSLMEEFENSSNMEDIEMNNSEIKLVRHQLDGSDAGTNGDSDYETLVEFNHPVDEDGEETVARVNGVENEMLTTLYEQHQADREKYPSLAITCALYNNKVYFNLSNCILYYDLSTNEVVLAKEYNTVHGLRDDTNPFGGMAFSTVNSASQADFTVENHPIAGISLKGDGKLYVSIATNFAFISGKDPHNSEDQSSYGYEFEESNFNSNYNSYTNDQMNNNQYGDMGYEAEENDNDEFMWSANFVETMTMSHFGGTSHTYQAVEVEASCGHNAYTENRCSNCGAIEAGSRVEVADTAHEHHYIRFDETYYTKDDNGNWNSGFCYICTECLFAIEEPTEPDPDQDYESAGTTYEEQLAIYEEQKAIYDDAAKNAGHTYVVVDGTWSADHNSVNFTKVECSNVCTERLLDCVLEDDTVTRTFNTSVTLSGSKVIKYEGDCTTGVYATYQIVGETSGITVTAETTAQLEAGDHPYEYTFVWNEVTDEDGNVVVDDEGYEMYTADATATCPICGDTRTATGLTATVDTAACVEPTVEASGKIVYTATATFTDENGKVLGTATGVKEIRLVAAPVISVSNKASNGKVVVSWDAVDGAEKYQVYRSTSKDSGYSRISTTDATSVTNTKNAEAGETYYYKVRAIAMDSGEYSEFSNVKARTVDLPRPDVTVKNVASSGKIKISWDAIDGAVEYKVYRSLNGEDGWKRISTTEKTSITNSKNCEVGETYYYKVIAIAEESNANSAYSSVKARTCDLPRPVITVKNVASSGKIKISWEAVDGAVEYKVYRSLDGKSDWSRIATTEKTSVTNTKNCEAGETYYYKVIAIAKESNANSAYSTVKARTCDLSRPSVSITRNSSGDPKLSWNKVEGAVEYKVYRSLNGEDGWTRISTTEKTTITNTKDVVAGRTYYYKVIAIAEDSAANSAYSKVISIKAK